MGDPVVASVVPKNAKITLKTSCTFHHDSATACTAAVAVLCTHARATGRTD